MNRLARLCTLARLHLSVALRYLRSLRGLGWLCRLCWLCVPLSLGVLRRRSLLGLCSYVGVSRRLYWLAIPLGYLSIALRRLGRLTGLTRLTRLTGLARLTGLSGLVGWSKVRHRPVAGSILALRTSRGTSLSTSRSANLGSSRGASLRGTLCDTCLCLCLCLCLRLWLGEVGV